MTMTGNQNINKDVVGPLVDDSLPPNVTGPFEQITQAIKNFIFPLHKELLTQLRAETPIKVTKTFTVPAGGVLGGGVAMPDLSQIIYTCPESAEAWLNRITITSPQHPPQTPYTTGALVLVGSTFGEIIVTAPDSPSANTIPIQYLEGGNAAPHLDRGESISISGTALTAADVIRVDMQIILATGASEFTPRKLSPSDLTRADVSPAL